MTDMSENSGGVGKRREQVVEDLMEHFANDVMDLTEFERRLDVANRAKSLEELNALLTDLPTSAALMRTSKLTPSRGGSAVVVPSEDVRDRSLMIAVFGGTSRRGRWVPARKNTAIGIMGGVQLDFREAMLGPGVTEVSLFACMGGIEIIVPPEMAVEVDGIAIMGGFDNETDTVLNRDPDQPLLRIKGLFILGGAEIAVRLPGESARDSKKRKKLERRELRELKSDWDG
ncbi:MAG: DUF1707 domain-containing protein [Gemmatimonadota bacterium]|nr:MAG: DUF1707 domain-containing protein [Gemmatimonadota bacterium]